MERRKDTSVKGTRMPQDYLKLVESLFNKNFAPHLVIRKGEKESFQANGYLYPDEALLSISLKQPGTIQRTTCIASIDYPPPATVEAQSTSDHVQWCMNQCIDLIGSFFQTFFEENRPVDYNLEYTQDWTKVQSPDKTTVYLRINRDNLELDAMADAWLEKAAKKTVQKAPKKRR